MSKLSAALAAQPHASPIADAGEVRRLYRHWRVRVMTSTMVGYAAFYLVRKNFSMAMPSFLTDLGYTKVDLGLILSCFSLLYGVGRFANGVAADRANPRYFMAIGLIGAAAVNVLFGMSSGLAAFGVFWVMNAWFQSMGFPPCARLLSQWFSPGERGTTWSLWNASHQIGGAGIFILAGWLIPHYGWRAAFYVPAAVAAAVAFVLVWRLRDTPPSLGLPPVEEYRGEATHERAEEDTAHSVKEILFKHVLTNRLVWFVALGNFFVYIVRVGVVDWAPTFLVEGKGSSLGGAGVKVAAFEVAGIFGALTAGFLSDRLFKGRRGPVNVLCMLLLAAALLLFWRIPAGYAWADIAALFVAGFAVYGPQILVSVAAADFATKKAAASATGFTGTLGYLGSAVCGVGTGLIVDAYGWDGGFVFFIAAALVGMLFFMLTWSHRSAVLDAIHEGRIHSATSNRLSEASEIA